jgi:mono/diheme cytochrome c family protein
MKIKTRPLFSFLIFCLVSAPAFLNAQGNHQGNHCAVQKSPYRLSMDSGHKIYASLCLGCHQADGMGSLYFNPPLNGKGVYEDKKKLIEIVIRGQANEEINGKSYQKVMPPNPELKDQEVADVLTYIRNSFGNKASSVKVSEVKSARSKLEKVE